MILNFFTAAARADDEAERQLAVDLLKHRSGPALVEVTDSAARQLGCPIALLTLIDGDTQRVAAATGSDLTQTPRAASFCAHTIVSAPGVLCVPDARLDQRFAANPFVCGVPHVRFYLGASLLDNAGHRLGALCVLDTRPHPSASAQQRFILQALASEAVARMQG